RYRRRLRSRDLHRRLRQRAQRGLWLHCPPGRARYEALVRIPRWSHRGSAAQEGTMTMDFCADFPRLEPAQKERFQRVVTRLLSGEILTPGSALRPDSDWLFAERYPELLDAYLRLGGWRLDIDRGLRLCRAVHEEGKQRVRLNKFESLVVCLLRLIYH